MSVVLAHRVTLAPVPTHREPSPVIVLVPGLKEISAKTVRSYEFTLWKYPRLLDTRDLWQMIVFDQSTVFQKYNVSNIIWESVYSICEQQRRWSICEQQRRWSISEQQRRWSICEQQRRWINMWTTKTLISLCFRTVWSASLLFAA